MSGACEVLFIIMLTGGGAELRSECKPTLAACWDRAREVLAENKDDSAMWQCVEIGALVDGGRASRGTDGT